MTSIHRAVQPMGLHSRDADKSKASSARVEARSFTRVATPPRDRAIQSLDTLCQDVNSRLGSEPLSFPVHGGQGIVSRIGSNVIVCNGPDNFYVEIVNGRITNKNGQPDPQIAAFLGAAKSALG